MDEIMQVFRENCYSRLPVYKEKIDNIVGLVHERDFYNAYLKGEKEIGHVVQNIVFTSEYCSPTIAGSICDTTKPNTRKKENKRTFFIQIKLY